MHLVHFGVSLNRAVRSSSLLCLVCCLLDVLLLATPALSQQPTVPPAKAPDTDAYIQLGISNGRKGDLDAAVATFNDAIAIDPKCVAAYENRGMAYRFQHKLDEALTDFNHVIQLEPNYQDAYNNRGITLGLKGNFDGALSDFNHLIQLNPKYPKAYYNSAHVKYFKGDLDGATTDLNQAMDLDANFPPAYFIWGLVRRAQGDRDGAASDFEKSSGLGFSNGAIWFWIVKMENSERGVAQQNLADFLLKPEQKDPWITQIANLLLGKVTSDQFLGTLKDPAPTKEHQCEAWFYVGVSKYFAGDPKSAQDCFLKCVATGVTYSEEYVEAQRELITLQKP